MANFYTYDISSTMVVAAVLLWLFLALSLSLLPAIIAKKKGYSFLLFYLVSIPCFFVTLIVILCMRDKREVVQKPVHIDASKEEIRQASNLADEFIQLEKRRESGELSFSEYEKAKNDMLK